MSRVGVGWRDPFSLKPENKNNVFSLSVEQLSLLLHDITQVSTLQNLYAALIHSLHYYYQTDLECGSGSQGTGNYTTVRVSEGT